MRHLHSVKAIRCGTFASVDDLIVAVGTFIDGWNDRCVPFAWTKIAEQIIPKATRDKALSRERH